MLRDTLFLLRPDFADPGYPGRRFYCWHCALLEGVLAWFPALGERLDVHRVDWPRPRRAVVDLLGPEHQSLPVLLLAHDAPDGIETGVANGRRFVEGRDAILQALAARHGIPLPHP